jgi:hypothetical protein
MMANDPRLETALHQLEATATSFGLRYIKMAEVRATYVQQIHEMSQSIRAAVQSGQLAADKGAEMAHAMRNEILASARSRDFDYGRALAQQMKAKGISLEKAIASAMKKLGLEGKPFQSLSGADQNRVFMEVIEGSGRSRATVTAGIPRLRWAARGLWIATLAIAAYNIGTAENPWWQSGREAANIAGGVGGGFAGGAAMGAAAGIWGGPVGVAVGVVVGGILGALLADHAYVQAAGTSDPTTRSFVARFTGFWTGVDEAGMAKALASEYRTNSAFVLRVIASLYSDYSSDADDVTLEYVNIARRDNMVKQTISGNRNLRDLLIRMLSEGWTSSEEQSAITFLRTL